MTSWLSFVRLERGNRFYFLLLAGAILLQIALVLVFAYKGLLPIAIALAIVVIFSKTIFSLDRLFYLIVIYYIAIEDKFYADNFPDVPIAFLWSIGYLLFLLLILHWVVYSLKERTTLSFKKLDVALIIFMTSILISAFLGFLRHHNFSKYRLEIMPLSLYLGYFIVICTPLKDKLKKFYDVILIGSVIIALEFLDAMIRSGGAILLARVVSMHIHMIPMAVAYIGTTLIYSENRKRKIVLGALLPLILLSVIISQQRSLWGSMIVILITMLFLYGYERRAWLKKNIINIVSGITVALLLLILSYFIMNSLTKGKVYNTIIVRGSILFNLSQLRYDESYIIRTNETAEALRTVGSDFLFGKGIGASIVTRWRYMVHATVDNTYAYIYWKMGILGILSFFGFYIIYFWRSMKLLRMKITNDERIFTLTTLLNFLALFVVGLANVCLVHYRFILVWAASIAMVESIARKYD